MASKMEPAMAEPVQPPLHPDLEHWRQTGQYHVWDQGRCSIFFKDLGTSEASPDRTLLLVHGFPEASFSYHKVIESLRTRFDRIVLVDFPGFGFSDKPERLSYSLFEQADALFSVWQECGVSGGHVLGHDMGDTVVTELVARSNQGLLPSWFADGLLSVTFTDGNMVMEEAALVPMQVLLRKPVLGRLLNALTSERVFRNQIRTANGTTIEDDDIAKLWQLNCLQNGHRLSWKIIRYLDDRDRFQNVRWLPALRQFEGPVHICWGEADKVSPPAVAHHLKDKIHPKAHLTLMPGVGHFCQLHAPKIWSEAVLAFYNP